MGLNCSEKVALTVLALLAVLYFTGLAVLFCLKHQVGQVVYLLRI